MEKGRQYLWSSRMLGLLGVLLAGGLLHSEPAYAQSACDTYPSWPQVAHDAQRSGKSPESLGTPGINYDRDGDGNIEQDPNTNANDVAWKYAFQPDKLFPQVQPIIYCGKVYVGTEGANGRTASMYALNATQADPTINLQAKVEWVRPIGSPILGSVAAGGDKVFFAAMNGKMYALDAVSGATVWEKQIIPLSDGRGFSASPLLADNKVMLGGRNGVFYAINTNDGSIAWQRNIGAPLLQTAAYNDQTDGAKRVFVGGMDMYMYALNASDGTQLWKTKVKGMAMKDYWPVVVRGRVLIYPIRTGRSSFNSSCITDLSSANCVKTLTILDETNGSELPVVPHASEPINNGPVTPPCVAPGSTNHVVLSADGAWSEVDLQSRSLVRQYKDATGEGGYNNTDENINISCTDDSVIAIHREGGSGCGGGAGFSGVFNTNNNKWTCWYRTLSTPSDEMHNNTQAGGGSPASVANGHVYHMDDNGITAVKTVP